MAEDEVKTAEEISAADVSGEAASADDVEAATEIRDTDIVFDCPHCGHNLAIDYRGAGLQIDCVNCGESVLVPIPAGMQIEDLDQDPGEILKQLFATRRNLQKVEQHAADLAERLRAMTLKRDALQSMLETALAGLDELKGISAERAAVQARADEILGRMSADLALGAAAEDALDAGDMMAEESGPAAE
ncbi:MAG: hypothetical protein ACI4Q3_01845 [Kiritimatiellia bacterium]